MEAHSHCCRGGSMKLSPLHSSRSCACVHHAFLQSLPVFTPTFRPKPACYCLDAGGRVMCLVRSRNTVGIPNNIPEAGSWKCTFCNNTVLFSSLLLLPPLHTIIMTSQHIRPLEFALNGFSPFSSLQRSPQNCCPPFTVVVKVKCSNNKNK